MNTTDLTIEDFLRGKNELFPDKEIKTITKDESIQSIAKKMIENDFSQMPVVEGDTLIGYVSWNTIMKSLSETNDEPLRYFPKDNLNGCIIESGTLLPDALNAIKDKDFLFVVDDEKSMKIKDIITLWDVAGSYSDMFIGMAYTENIELKLRKIINTAKPDKHKIEKIINRKIKNYKDLHLGNYEFVFADDEIWGKIKDSTNITIDKEELINDVKQIAFIRNYITHFTWFDNRHQEHLTTLKETNKKLSRLIADLP